MDVERVVFLYHLEKAATGDCDAKTQLALFLRSHELTLQERNKLADYIEGKFKRRRGRPVQDDTLISIAVRDLRARKVASRAAGKRPDAAAVLQQTADYWCVDSETLNNAARRSQTRGRRKGACSTKSAS